MSVLDQIQDAALAPRSLAENEEIVSRGLETFVEVGLALMQIRDERQYREAGFDRFDDYCKNRWQFGRERAHRLIEAAEVTSSVLPMGNTPAPSSERVARELAQVAKADPEQAREVWAAAVDQHGDRPTAKQVAETRDRITSGVLPVASDEQQAAIERAHHNGGHEARAQAATDLGVRDQATSDDTEEVDAEVIDTAEPAPYDRTTKCVLAEAGSLYPPNIAHEGNFTHAIQHLSRSDLDRMDGYLKETMRVLRIARNQIQSTQENTNA